VSIPTEEETAETAEEEEEEETEKEVTTMELRTLSPIKVQKRTIYKGLSCPTYNTGRL